MSKYLTGAYRFRPVASVDDPLLCLQVQVADEDTGVYSSNTISYSWRDARVEDLLKVNLATGLEERLAGIEAHIQSLLEYRRNAMREIDNVG